MATEMSTTAPDMSIASDLHTLSLTPSNKTLSAAVLAKITTQKCATLHAKLQSTYSWPALPATVGGETAATENTLLAKIDEAVKDSGETDTLAAHEKLAEFYSETINVDKAMERYKIILELPKTSTSAQINANLSMIRLHLFSKTPSSALVAKCEGLLEHAGDWDKRNRVKVYKSLSLCLTRDYMQAAPLLLSCVKTFSCEELITYDHFVNVTTILNLLSLPRPELKESIIDSPEILASISPPCKAICDALYACDYASYFRAIIALEPTLQNDMYLHSHTTQIIRQLTVLGYQQFLQSYKTVTLAAMANSFSVSTNYLDLQLSTFIATNSLQCKIDAVSGTVETVRVEGQEKGYRKIVEEGDRVLNKILKLSRVVDV